MKELSAVSVLLFFPWPPSPTSFLSFYTFFRPLPPPFFGPPSLSVVLPPSFFFLSHHPSPFFCPPPPFFLSTPPSPSFPSFFSPLSFLFPWGRSVLRHNTSSAMLLFPSPPPLPPKQLRRLIGSELDFQISGLPPRVLPALYAGAGAGDLRVLLLSWCCADRAVSSSRTKPRHWQKHQCLKHSSIYPPPTPPSALSTAPPPPPQHQRLKHSSIYTHTPPHLLSPAPPPPTPNTSVSNIWASTPPPPICSPPTPHLPKSWGLFIACAGGFFFFFFVLFVLRTWLVWLNLFNVDLSLKRYWWERRSQEAGEEEDYNYYTYRYTVATRMTPALTGAAMRAILMFV